MGSPDNVEATAPGGLGKMNACDVRCPCGRKLHANTIRWTSFYRCAATDAVQPCRTIVRDAALLPWAHSHCSKGGSPGAGRVRRRCPARSTELPARATGTLENIKASQERLGKRFEWEHTSAAPSVSAAGADQARSRDTRAGRRATDRAERRPRRMEGSRPGPAEGAAWRPV